MFLLVNSFEHCEMLQMLNAVAENIIFLVKLQLLRGWRKIVVFGKVEF